MCSQEWFGRLINSGKGGLCQSHPGMPKLYAGGSSMDTRDLNRPAEWRIKPSFKPWGGQWHGRSRFFWRQVGVIKHM